MNDLANIRREYEHGDLDESEMDADPFRQLRTWLDAAVASKQPEPTAMTLATATADGRPSARTVLLKGVDERGLLLFTNLNSRKAKELAENPRAAVVLYWAGLERQVRVTGEVTAASREEVEAYHERRPRQSQLAAAASRQSAPIADRDELERRFAETAEQYDGQQVPCPPFWGGYRIVPNGFEFWQGRANRLHDRLRYVPAGGGRWRLERLSP